MSGREFTVTYNKVNANFILILDAIFPLSLFLRSLSHSLSLTHSLVSGLFFVSLYAFLMHNVERCRSSDISEPIIGGSE